MATVHREIPVQSGVETAWTKVADLGGVHEMMSFLINATIDGDRRTCELAMGGELAELVLSVDRDLRRVAYAITDSPFGLEFHAASMQVVERADGVRLLWTTDVKPDAAADKVAGLIDSELDNVAKFLNS